MFRFDPQAAHEDPGRGPGNDRPLVKDDRDKALDRESEYVSRNENGNEGDRSGKNSQFLL